MNKQQWLAIFEAELLAFYGVSPSDMGWLSDELYHRWGDVDPAASTG
jgi:hypothetical protein